MFIIYPIVPVEGIVCRVYAHTTVTTRIRDCNIFVSEDLIVLPLNPLFILESIHHFMV